MSLGKCIKTSTTALPIEEIENILDKECIGDYILDCSSESVFINYFTTNNSESLIVQELHGSDFHRQRYEFHRQRYEGVIPREFAVEALMSGKEIAEFYIEEENNE